MMDFIACELYIDLNKEQTAHIPITWDPRRARTCLKKRVEDLLIGYPDVLRTAAIKTGMPGVSLKSGAGDTTLVMSLHENTQ